ncbi:polysaccharide biosynthesis/export family protein [Luteolibacter sp. AS25]|uniref:polysaccharide biosynthesis/export family protein n=1 Tax=Luteolibacter sp. AS25 TaxID=3135776 RepID=UPI00398AC28C
MKNFSKIFIATALWLVGFPCFSQTQDSSYVLRPNDEISLDVYGEPDLSSEVKILKTGQASFPLIGSVKIGGLTVAKAAKQIADLYNSDYLVDPKLTLSVKDYATEYVSVIGAVMTPGQISLPISGNLDLAGALATAGGPSQTADSNGILLVRASGGTSSFSLGSIQGGAGKIVLKPGDRVVVNQSKYIGRKVTVLGQVNKPGPVSFPLSGRLDIVNAIALSGGMTEYANPKKISINRKGQILKINFLEVAQRGDRPYLIYPDDVITVSERFF